MSETVGGHYPLFPFRYLLLDPWPSAERAGRVKVPAVVFHGTEDAMVPVGQGRALAAALPQGRFVELPGRGHNDVPGARLRAALRSFFPEFSPAGESYSEPADPHGVGE